LNSIRCDTVKLLSPQPKHHGRFVDEKAFLLGSVAEFVGVGLQFIFYGMVAFLVAGDEYLRDVGIYHARLFPVLPLLQYLCYFLESAQALTT
jgi:hypothetical protein